MSLRIVAYIVGFPGGDRTLVPAVAAGGLSAGLGQQRDVLGHNAGFEPGVRVRRAVGRIGHRRRPALWQARDLIAVLRAAVPIGGVAYARDDVVDRQRGCELGLRQDAGEIARHVGHFGVGLGARLIVGRHAVGAGQRQHLLRIERRHGCGEFRACHGEVGRYADERARSHDFAVADLGGVADRKHLARGAAFASRRQPVALAVGELVADRADGAAERVLDPLRHGGEIGFAVERGKNGAAHEGRAADAGQNRAGKPLNRNAAAIDDTAGAAIHRKRRLVAEIDGRLHSGSVCARPGLVQTWSPLHSRSRPSVRKIPQPRLIR